MQDVGSCLASIQVQVAKTPVVILGHSLGGLIAIRSAGMFQERLAALILSAPYLGLARPVPYSLRLLVHALNAFVPRLPLKNGVDPRNLSHIESEVKAYREDPLVHPWITPRSFTEIEKAIREAADDAQRIRIPTLLILPGRDAICSTAASLEWFKLLRSPRKQAIVYPESLHEPLNDLDRNRFLGDVVRWLGEI